MISEALVFIRVYVMRGKCVFIMLLVEFGILIEASIAIYQ